MRFNINHAKCPFTFSTNIWTLPKLSEVKLNGDSSRKMFYYDPSIMTEVEEEKSGPRRKSSVRRLLRSFTADRLTSGVYHELNFFHSFHSKGSFGATLHRERPTTFEQRPVCRRTRNSARAERRVIRIAQSRSSFTGQMSLFLWMFLLVRVWVSSVWAAVFLSYQICV